MKTIQLKYKESYGNKRFYPDCDYSQNLLQFVSYNKKCFTLEEYQVLKGCLGFDVIINNDIEEGLNGE